MCRVISERGSNRRPTGWQISTKERNPRLPVNARQKKKAELEVNDYYYLTQFGSEQHSPHKS